MKEDLLAHSVLMNTMPDNRFWSVGDNVGRAWKDGAKYREQLKQKKSK